MIFFSKGSFIIGDGSDTLFWEDTWLGTTPLSSQYPILYNIVQHKNVTVAHVLSNALLNISFTQALIGEK